MFISYNMAFFFYRAMNFAYSKDLPSDFSIRM